ncbi:hypothetical protein ACUVMQ_20165 [Aeromonas veronii]|uniref:hypothetical protein n=1 Tax=Aeromonas veronii TaxID=654 RepID=UPI003F3D5784
MNNKLIAIVIFLLFLILSGYYLVGEKKHDKHVVGHDHGSCMFSHNTNHTDIFSIIECDIKPYKSQHAFDAWW